MRMCLNRNVLIGLGAVAAAVLLLAPNLFGAALPLLVLAACPLSMVFMMRAMGGSGAGRACDSNPPAGTADDSRLIESTPVATRANGNGSAAPTPEEIQAELRQLEAKQRELAEQLNSLQRHSTTHQSTDR